MKPMTNDEVRGVIERELEDLKISIKNIDDIHINPPTKDLIQAFSQVLEIIEQFGKAKTKINEEDLLLKIRCIVGDEDYEYTTERVMEFIQPTVAKLEAELEKVKRENEELKKGLEYHPFLEPIGSNTCQHDWQQEYDLSSQRLTNAGGIKWRCKKCLMIQRICD